MQKYTFKTQGQLKPIDKDYYDVLIDKNVLSKLSLKYSKEVKLASETRRKQTSKRMGYEKVEASNETSQSQISARLKDGRLLDKSIHLYRLWFNFLKLALELEELNVELVTQKHTYITSRIGVPQSVIDRSIKEKEQETKKSGKDKGGKGSSSAIWRSKLTKKIKVKRSAYKGWDLDEVLTQPFNSWWKTHSHLFEGHYPSVLKKKDEWIDNPDFIYLRIDKNSQIRDVNKFYDEEIKPKLKNKESGKFKILGKNARSNVIQNNFNALVLKLKGWSAKEICTHKNIYLRKTDEMDGNSRTKTDRLTISKDKKGKLLYDQRVSIQKDKGIWHLLEVCEGRFGLAKPSK